MQPGGDRASLRRVTGPRESWTVGTTVAPRSLESFVACELEEVFMTFSKKSSDTLALSPGENSPTVINIQCLSALSLISVAPPCAKEDCGRCRFADSEGNNDFRVLSQIPAKTMASWPLSSQCKLFTQGLASSRCFIATESCHNHPAYWCRTFWLPKLSPLIFTATIV